MNWIKTHKFWMALVVFFMLSFIVDLITSLNVARTAGQFTTIAIVIKLVSWIFKNKKKEANNAK